MGSDYFDCLKSTPIHLYQATNKKSPLQEAAELSSFAYAKIKTSQ